MSRVSRLRPGESAPAAMRFAIVGPRGLEHVGRFPHLVAELVRRGWSDDALAGLVSGNVLRVMRGVERVGRTLRKTETARVGRIEDFDGPAARPG